MGYIPGKKNELMEIDRLYESISSFSFKKNHKEIINEAPQKVVPSKYNNIDFKNIGHGNPISDKINPSLLADVDKAAGIAGTKASVTTAVSGHRPGTRHELGLAVDVAMFDGKGYSGVESAKKQGIYNKIEKFVRALENMGYKVNSERGHDKAVLWFGFKNHHHHVHISRKSDDGVSDQEKKYELDKEKTKEIKKEKVYGENFCECLKKEKENKTIFKFLDAAKKCEPSKTDDDLITMGSKCVGKYKPNIEEPTSTSKTTDFEKSDKTTNTTIPQLKFSDIFKSALKEEKISKDLDKVKNILRKVL